MPFPMSDEIILGFGAGRFVAAPTRYLRQKCGWCVATLAVCSQLTGAIEETRGRFKDAISRGSTERTCIVACTKPCDNAVRVE